MKNNNKKAEKSYLYIIFLALAFVILLGTGAYAYYQTTITGTISGNVSKWSFKANNQSSEIYVDIGSVYPGVDIYRALELSAEDSDLDVYYEVYFAGRVYFGTESSNLQSAFNNNAEFLFNIYENRIINSYSEDQVGWLDYALYEYKSNLYPETGVGFYGVIPAGEVYTFPLNFNWDYGATSESPTKYNGLSFDIPIYIIARQCEENNPNGICNGTSYANIAGFIDYQADESIFLYPIIRGYSLEELGYNESVPEIIERDLVRGIIKHVPND